ncbi:MAG TPA: hypothetical protein ENI37_01420 [Chloroflexi bacterium]|nr:hypothetical protein [Chloroflexota bacterium]
MGNPLLGPPHWGGGSSQRLVVAPPPAPTDPQPAPEERPMKRYRVTLEGQTFDVEVLDDPRLEQVRVRVNGEVFTVEVKPVAEGTPTVLLPLERESATMGRIVEAPLPGVIKSIAVRRGKKVAVGDELLVIEAMKMDNVIRAQREGTVGMVYVTEGRQVAYGEPLLKMDR